MCPGRVDFMLCRRRGVLSSTVVENVGPTPCCCVSKLCNTPGRTSCSIPTAWCDPACLADWWFRSCGVVGIGRVHPCALKVRHVQHLGILNMHRGCWETSQALVCSTVLHTVMLCRRLVKSESKVASIVNDPSNTTPPCTVSLQS